MARFDRRERRSLDRPARADPDRGRRSVLALGLPVADPMTRNRLPLAPWRGPTLERRQQSGSDGHRSRRRGRRLGGDLRRGDRGCQGGAMADSWQRSSIGRIGLGSSVRAADSGASGRSIRSTGESRGIYGAKTLGHDRSSSSPVDSPAKVKAQVISPFRSYSAGVGPIRNGIDPCRGSQVQILSARQKPRSEAISDLGFRLSRGKNGA